MSKLTGKLVFGAALAVATVMIGMSFGGAATASAASINAATATCPSTVPITTVAPGTTATIGIALSQTDAEAGEGEYFQLSDGTTPVNYNYANGNIVVSFTATSSPLSITGCTTGEGYDSDEGAIVTSISASPDTLAACKKGGWTSLVDSEGNSFKNQGDCVSYVATQGKNLGDIAPAP